MKKRWLIAVVVLLLALLGAGTWFATTPPGGGPGIDETVEIVVPAGAGALAIGQQLRSAGLVRYPRFFALAARTRGVEGSLKAGRYRVTGDMGWGEILDVIAAGEVVTFPLTVPEGFTVRELAPRVAEATGVDADSVARLAMDSSFVAELGVPGPTLEGYLFPETYRFAEGLAPADILREMVTRYQAYWTPERRGRLDSLSLDERGLVTLASIVEEEARVADERPIIAGVYTNRLEIGMLLQADPTVQYALGEPKARLLFADIDRVADDPYNTYTHAGLPPGPIASPGASSLDAALYPADVPYLFFVARPDGSHEFTRTNREHVNARNRIRREQGE
ncbi:MAG: endolytic transglycosylase MltG [Gemmatimonadota bacterium]